MEVCDSAVSGVVVIIDSVLLGPGVVAVGPDDSKLPSLTGAVELDFTVVSLTVGPVESVVNTELAGSVELDVTAVDTSVGLDDCVDINVDIDDTTVTISVVLDVSAEESINVDDRVEVSSDDPDDPAVSVTDAVGTVDSLVVDTDIVDDQSVCNGVELYKSFVLE